MMLTEVLQLEHALADDDTLTASLRSLYCEGMSKPEVAYINPRRPTIECICDDQKQDFCNLQETHPQFNTSLLNVPATVAS